MQPNQSAWAYLDGTIVPLEQAKLPVYDAGFVYGATVSDVLRTFGRQWFRFDDHARRFLRSCQYVGIDLPQGCDELRAIADELLARTTGHECGLVMLATPGIVSLYAGLSREEANRTGPHLVMHLFPLRPGQFRRLYERGLHAIVAANRQVPVDCWDPKAKCRSRLHWWLAQRQVQALDPEAVPLLLDHQGNLTESATANIVVVLDGTVYSVPPDRILWGISLQTLKELCEAQAVPFATRSLQAYHAAIADEILLTNSLYSLAPVTKLNGHAVGDGCPGPIFRRLYQAWSELVGGELAAF